MSHAVDFLPPDYRDRRDRRRVWVIRGVVLATLALAMTGATFAVETKRARLRQDLTAVRERHEQARSRIAQVELLGGQKGELSRRLGVLDHVLRRARGALVLEAVGSAFESGATRLSKVDLRLLRAGDVPRVEVTIEGRAAADADVANLMVELSERPLLRDVRMVLSEDVDSASNEKKFVITARSPGLLDQSLLERTP